jgi:hypothetical protein
MDSYLGFAQCVNQKPQRGFLSRGGANLKNEAMPDPILGNSPIAPGF